MGYSIYKGDIEKDKHEILRFWKENHTKTLDNKYAWIYEGNPAGKAIVWILKDEISQQIAGMAVIFLRRYSVCGIDMLAGVNGDFLVSKTHRTLGPAMMIQRSIMSSVDNGDVDFIYGFPNKNAEPVTKRIGFECLGETIRLVKIFKTAPILTKMRWPGWLITVTAPLLDLALKIVFIDKWPVRNNGYICREIKKVDDSFNQLWVELKSLHKVVGDRSASVIAWKYLNDPDDDNKIFAMYGKDFLKLKGYVVYRLDAESIEIRDLAVSEGRKALKALIANFVRYVSPIGSKSITITMLKNDYIVGILKRFGFARGKSDGRVYLYCNKEKLHLLGRAENWFLMRSDEDS